MGKDYTRVHRLLKVITLIQNQRQLGPDDLARLCEISTRMVYRDIQAINDAGIGCEYDDVDKGYRIGRGFYMPPVELTAEEALGLANDSRGQTASGFYPLYATFWSALWVWIDGGGGLIARVEVFRSSLRKANLER